MKTSLIEHPSRCITPTSKYDNDQFQQMESSDDESLPHMLSPNCEDDCGYPTDNDAWPSPMTNSMEDDRSASRRAIELSSTSSISSHYPQSEAEYLALNTLMSSIPRHRRKSSSCENIVVTDEEGSCNDRVQMQLQPRFSSRRSPSPTDSYHSSQNTLHQIIPSHSNQTHHASNSWDSSPRSRNTYRPSSRKDEQDSPVSTNLRPPPSPTPSLLTSNTRKQMLHRRSVSLNLGSRRGGSQSPELKLSTLDEGHQNQHTGSHNRTLSTGTYSPSSSLPYSRRHRVKHNTHRRTVSFPDQVVQPHPNSHSASNPQRSNHYPSTASQSNDPALFSLFGGTMGGHPGRVCISRDVDPQLTHGLHAVEEVSSASYGGALKTHRSVYVGDEGSGGGKEKKRNRKLARRSRSRSRKSKKAGSKSKEQTQDSMHMMKRSEDDEVVDGKNHSMRNKLAAILVKKPKGNFGQKSIDKLTKQSSGSNLGEERRVNSSKRFHNEKSKQTTSTAAAIRTEEQSMESDCFKPTHMESIVEEEGTRLHSKKFINKPGCIIQ